jgi:SAM-dependent methyltransferase
MNVSAARTLERYGVRPSTRCKGWRRVVWRQTKASVARLVRKALAQARGRTVSRDQKIILAEYDKQWRKKGFESYRPRDLKGAGGPWIWGRQRFFLSNEGGAAIRLVYLEETLRNLRPRSVLEVGCGNGINLHLLATRYPDVQFCGVEPTPEGVAMAQRVVETGTLPEALREFAPFELRDARAVRGVRITRGSGAALPFADRSFDVVMTSLALEQMEQIRDRALSELARVSAGHVVMLEPFAEVNGGGLRRAYVKAYDYFEGPISELHGYGLEVVSVLTDMPHKAWLGTALVVARRKG